MSAATIALYWVRSDKSMAWIPSECVLTEHGYRDLLTSTLWKHGHPATSGHPDERIDAMFRAAYRQPATQHCAGCDYLPSGMRCPGDSSRKDSSIEDGGTECAGTIWKRCRK